MSSQNRNLIIGVVIIIIIILFIPMIPVKVAYTETESYERNARYEVVSATLKRGFDLIRGDYTISEVVIKNIDKKGGTFTVTHYLYTVNGLFGTKTTSDYIAPGEIKVFRAEFDTTLGQDVRGEYSVTPPKIVDEHVVVKYKTVYKSIIEFLLYG